MAMKCDQCGGPLHPIGDAPRVECAYCGCVHQLREPEPAAKAAGEGTAVGRPGPEPGPVPGPVLLGCGLVLGVMLIAGVIAVIVFSNATTVRLPPTSSSVTVERRPIGSGRARPVDVAPRDPRAEVDWRTLGTCPVDADGDGIGDYASMVWSSREQDRPTIVSGADGRILWQGASLPQNTPFHCISREIFAVEHKGFRVELFHAQRPAKPIEVTLRDKLSRVAAGNGCVSLEAADGSVTGVRLPQGTKAPCRAGKGRRARSMYTGVIQRHHRRGTATLGDRRFVLKLRRRGTPMLTLEAHRKGRRLWSKELALQATGTGTGLAAAPGVILVFGVKPAAPEVGLLVAYDPATGAQKYEQKLRHHYSSHLAHFDYNGKLLVIAAWVGLHAYDPTTGQRKWFLGR
ncbi:MAG: PQQ-binding-like beta-propeller repeat protein [bacterium]